MKCHSYPYTCFKRSLKWKVPLVLKRYQKIMEKCRWLDLSLDFPLFHIFMLSSKLLWGISVISSQVFKFQYVPFVYKKLIDHFIMTKKILKLSIHHFCFLRLWYIICCIVFDLSTTCKCSQFFEVLNIFANNNKLFFFLSIHNDFNMMSISFCLFILFFDQVFLSE